jgi:hypothetical protein
MANYSFIQRYRWGEDWNGEVVDIPEDAIFYNVENISLNQQEWYIIIPNKSKYIMDLDEEEDIENLFQGEGCIQVTTYELLDYIILHLANIVPIGEWKSVSQDVISNLFKDKIYINEYQRAQYKINFNNIGEDVFIKIKDEELLSSSKVVFLSFNGDIAVKKISLKNIFTENDDTEMVKTYYRLCDLNLNISDKIRFEITSDSTIYNESLNKVIEFYK